MLCQQGFFNFFLSLSSHQAMRRILAELRVILDVGVSGGNDGNRVIRSVLGEPAKIGNDLLGPGNVEFSLGRQEVNLRVHVPKKKFHLRSLLN